MRKFVLGVILILAAVTMLWAQNDIDSLKGELQKIENDSTEVDLLIAISSKYVSSSPGEAIKYATQALELANQIGYEKGKAYSLKNIGLGYYMEGNYLEVLVYWQRSLATFEEMDDLLGQGNILNNLGAVYFNQGDDTKAMEFYFKSLTISEKIGDKLRIATALTNIGAVYFNKPETHDRALKYYLDALKVSEEIGDQAAIGTSSVNIGELNLEKKNFDEAVTYFNKALDALEKSGDQTKMAYTLNNIGKVYAGRKEFPLAEKYQADAFTLAEKLNAKLEMSQARLGLADTYKMQAKWKQALTTYQDAMQYAKEIGSYYELKAAYEGLAITYSALTDYQNAFTYQNLLTGIKDTLYNAENNKRIEALQFNFDIEKKQSEIDLLTKDKALQDLQLQRQKFATNAFLGGLVLILIIAGILYNNNRHRRKANTLLARRNDEISQQKEEIATQRDNLDKQNAQIENLLLNILPKETKDELQVKGYATPRNYESVTVLFTDFAGFTRIAEEMTPQELVNELNEFFLAFDNIIEQCNLEKIKTIGDAYMCAGGIPVSNETHPFDAVRAGLAIQHYVAEANQRRKQEGKKEWILRLGIHTGPVVAGVVGKKKFAYDIWGDAVNIASRMESGGVEGHVNISASVYAFVKDQFHCEYRGKIPVKNKGEVDMYLVSGAR